MAVWRVSSSPRRHALILFACGRMAWHTFGTQKSLASPHLQAEIPPAAQRDAPPPQAPPPALPEHHEHQRPRPPDPNSGGVLVSTVFPGKFAMEISSAVYRNWKLADSTFKEPKRLSRKLADQTLPNDLLRRHVATELLHNWSILGLCRTDELNFDLVAGALPSKIRLLIKDYPFAVDGIDIWSAIETWVADYCSIYCSDEAEVAADEELQAWWKEIREVGHGDKQNESCWPAMATLPELVRVCTTVIWVASALQSAVNLGQYPTISLRVMPDPARFAGVRGAPAEAGERILEDDHEPVPDNVGGIADRDSVEAFVRRGVSRAAGVAGVDGAPAGQSRVSGLTGRGLPNSISI
ncbi:linoleate 9S-lipoxygenase [Apostasia shenzhenica]|uniref:Linoleate 9S-lipoxygenase n=1 Tax=Apostasia shenzhenica TaxID=1088818 RepID=A0A2I0B0R4_9ASPA|nr:linoleate 9S-lipoxygenase [Apostasia shenzhenica]